MILSPGCCPSGMFDNKTSYICPYLYFSFLLISHPFSPYLVGCCLVGFEIGGHLKASNQVEDPLWNHVNHLFSSPDAKRLVYDKFLPSASIAIILAVYSLLIEK